ncbi:MAG: hypothetical protein HY813_00025 [Candidatus Portnoybacteria bacterium]|nr:hypothetical protein [Candidatus Portnoybacteria bacterium]
MRKDLDGCFRLIQSEDVRNFVKKALAAAPPEFWTASASSSGKYHPPEDRVEGGIIVHTRKAVRVALDLFRFFAVQHELTKDMIIAAIILHDIQKNGIPWGLQTSYEHGRIACEWLMQFAGSNPALIVICLLVRDHMGVWSQPGATPALKCGGVVDHLAIAHLVVQMADYWASRKWCPFICDNFAE